MMFFVPKDKEDGVYTRDFAKPTLEDHFDKTVLQLNAEKEII